MFTADVRFEGWTTDDWLRFLQLWRPRSAADTDARRPRGGIVVVHDGEGHVVKLLHTRQGRLDPALIAAGSTQADAQSVALRAGQAWALAQLARTHDVSW